MKKIVLQAVRINEYRNSKGTLVHVYAVKGKAEQLKVYQDSRGEYASEDEDGNPLFFNGLAETQDLGDNITLVQTQKGQFIGKASNEHLMMERVMTKVMREKFIGKTSANPVVLEDANLGE